MSPASFSCVPSPRTLSIASFTVSPFESSVRIWRLMICFLFIVLILFGRLGFSLSMF